jgi:hypothetical protein
MSTGAESVDPVHGMEAVTPAFCTALHIAARNYGALLVLSVPQLVL